MPSRIVPITPLELYEKTFNQEDFVLFAARQYWRPIFIFEPSETRTGRVIAFIGKSASDAGIGITLGVRRDEELIMVRKIPSQRRDETDEDKYPITVHFGDILCWLQIIPKAQPVNEDKMWRLIVKTPNSECEHTVGCFFSEAEAARCKAEYEKISSTKNKQYTYYIKEI